jgi:hypothetical protein
MTLRISLRSLPRYAIAAALFAAIAGLPAGCATEGSANYGAYYYSDGPWYDSWYYGGCCVDRPDDIGPIGPHPEHPIARPPGGGERPSQPIATPRASSPSPRPAMSGGGFRGGGGRGGRR